MTLSKTIDFKGIIVDRAYIRISGLNIHPGNYSMHFLVHNMVDSGAEPFDQFSEACSYNLEGGNPIRQAYDYLKTTDRFIGSEDC